MTGDALLDTSAVVAVFQGDPLVREQILRVGECLVSAVTAGELYFGAWRSDRRAENLARVDDFLSRHGVVEVNTAVARTFAIVKANLYATGRPIPVNDLWIAATAMCHDLTMITRDAHFGFVANLKVATW